MRLLYLMVIYIYISKKPCEASILYDINYIRKKPDKSSIFFGLVYKKKNKMADQVT